jgi:regulator of protease activity HflC (stomatin/prohibitin superfamily)
MDAGVNFSLVVSVGLVVLVVVILFKTAQVVPQKSAYIVERLGMYA